MNDEEYKTHQENPAEKEELETGRGTRKTSGVIPFSVRNDTFGVRRSLPPPAQKQRLLHSRGGHF
jgi:hypothetical protein